MQMVHIHNAAPNDEMSEEFLILGIRNLRSTLEVEDVAEGINSALSSVNSRGGMLNDDSAHVRRSTNTYATIEVSLVYSFLPFFLSHILSCSW